MSPTKTARKTAREPARTSLSAALRAAIAKQEWTAYGLGKAADVDAGVIQRFLNRERDIRLETADRLAAVLKLRLVEGDGRRGKGRGAKVAEPGAEES